MTNLPFSSRSHDYIRDLANMSDQDFLHHVEQVAHANANTIPTPSEKYLVCKAGKGRFILSYSELREVTSSPRYYTYLPSSPNWMPGLAVWRDEVIATVNFAAYASHSSSTTPATNMLVISHDNMAIGLLLDVIESVTDLPSGPLPNTQSVPEMYATFPCSEAITRVYASALVLAIPPLFTHLLHAIQGTPA
jgi:chemotaxis signal transduction protein